MPTIKSQVMAAIKAELETITALKSVKRMQAANIDLDRVPKPALYLWDEREEIVRKIKVVSQARLTLTMFLFIELTPAGLESFNAIADSLQGEIEAAIEGLINPETGLLHSLESESISKEFPDDKLACLIMEFVIVYGHTWGAPSSRVNA